MSESGSANFAENQNSEKSTETKEDNIDTSKNIKIPTFRKISEDEWPYNFDDISMGATDNVAAQILENHTRLELIEDRIDNGNEKRVTHPSSIIKIFHMQEEYDLDNEETAKLSKCTSKPTVTIIARNWPKRIYDDENVKMSDKLYKEYLTRYNDYLSQKNKNKPKTKRNDQKSEPHATQVAIPRQPKVKFQNNDLRTESETKTDDEDFRIGLN